MPIYVRSKRSAPQAPPVPRAASSKKGDLLFGLPEPPAGWAQKPPGISLCMIVKNEERFLAQCLRSVQDVVDEMIVVDTGSTDRTIEIAKSFGATVFEREWRNDFGWARNQALEAATRRWLLVLDADEELMTASKPSLAALKNVPSWLTAVWVRIYNRSDDYVGTGDMSHALVRIFPNHESIRYRGLIHEFPTVNGDPNGLGAASSPIGVIHHGYVKEIVHERGKGARNLAIVKAAADREPTDPYNWFNVGATAFLLGDFETARDALEKMLDLLGEERRGYLPNGLAILAETYCDKLADPIKGEEIARRGLEISPHYANSHFQLGKALIAQKRFDEGREAYLAAIDDGKYAAQQFVVDDQVYIWKAHSEIGSSYVMQGDEAKAVEWFEKGLKNSPNAEPLHVNRARALERLGRLDDASEAFRTVYELHGSASSTIEYVNALLRRGRDGDAMTIVDATIGKFESDMAVPMLMAAAAVAERGGDGARAERYLRAAAEHKPGSAAVVAPLEKLLRASAREGELPGLFAREDATPPESAADFLRRSQRAANDGRFADALALARAGLEHAPADENLRYAVAYSTWQTGDDAAALHMLDRLDVSESDRLRAREALRSAIYRKQGRLDDAIRAIDALLAADPSHVDSLLLRAGMLETLGRLDEQEETLRRAYEYDRQRVAIPLSSLYLRTKRYDEAARVAEDAMKTS
ncbi:MAG TPA: glycosyltransferase [Candidatus Acidoferrales bacterium]|jgi:tetratricopeptide (TPR) repeat protein|nr:glycosyltransferase [Candidatus Acidoferrales bacterium]